MWQKLIFRAGGTSNEILEWGGGGGGGHEYCNGVGEGTMKVGFLVMWDGPSPPETLLAPGALGGPKGPTEPRYL